MENYEVAEVCPWCESEITMTWNVEDRGYQASCPVCGKRLMLCDECRHSEDGLSFCDYDTETDSCHRQNRTEEKE